MAAALPKISIITPSYNQGHFLEETILSVLGQNYPNLEYIVMDGGSTDNSVEIIKKYTAELKHWVSEKDNGQAAAINSGFKVATGNILLWLNSDDMLMPNVLNYIADSVAASGDGLYFGDCLHFRKQENGPLDAWGSNVANEHKEVDLAAFDYIIQPSSYWTKAVWQKIGLLNEKLHYGFDWEWFLRVNGAGIKLINVNRCLSLYRYHSDHKSKAGGIERQSELLGIYKQYCPEKADLYALLMGEKSKNPGLKFRIIKKWASLFRKHFSYGKLLKTTYPSKYASFTAADIDLLIRML